ncbi:hypothetical protein F383_09274 [Gossypium arboreum]|uniref:Uncharacterized protein n=1 Tax=Gossypium arboreum TaxID=29729 RepID=A0A0B0NA05_GOSAR|nr:hypothetical protein F383_09274 [Gossypium arboreum]
MRPINLVHVVACTYYYTCDLTILNT